MKRTTWLIVALSYLAFAEILSWAPVPDLSLCLIEPSHNEQPANHNNKKYCPAFHVGAALALEKTDVFLERHDKSVIGTFTIVLALSTIGLWMATDRLWKAGESQRQSSERIAERQRRSSEHIAARQLQSMRNANQTTYDGVRAAQKAAEAAMLSAKASIGLELPFLRVEATRFGPGTSKNPDDSLRHYFSVAAITISNTGRTKAVPVEIDCGWTFGPKLPPEPTYPWGTGFKVDAVIDPAPVEPVEYWLHELLMDVPADALAQLKNGDANFWFYIRLFYLDFMRTQHVACFCWRRSENFYGGTGQFHIDDTPAYNTKT